MFKNKVDYSGNKNKYNSYSGEIARLVPSGSTVLDIGCATGKLAKILKQKKCKVFGVDIDQSSLKQAAKQCYKVAAVDIDNLTALDKAIKTSKFDAITLGDILEHIKYPGVLLKHVSKYLAKDGVIVASIPNTAFVWNRARFLLGNFSYTKHGGLMDEDHLRFFSFATAKVLFKDSGYDLQRVYGASNVRARFWFLRYLARICPTIFAIHIIILAKNKAQNEKRK